MADMGHKIFSPDTCECALCALTHDNFTGRGQWSDFVESLDRECIFLHRDEFLRRHPGQSAPLPAIFLLCDGRPECCADTDAIGECRDLTALEAVIRTQCAAQPGEWPYGMPHLAQSTAEIFIYFTLCLIVNFLFLIYLLKFRIGGVTDIESSLGFAHPLPDLTRDGTGFE